MNDQIVNMLKNAQPSNEQFKNALKNMSQVVSQYAATRQNPLAGSEQISNAVKASIETQVAFLNTMTASTMATIVKIIELNMTATRATMEESAVITKQLLSSKDPQEVQALLGALPQSVSAKAKAYSQHVTNIASTAQAELTRAAEQQFANVGLKLSALMGQVSKTMPAGFENSAAVAKGVIANASAGYEQFNKNAQPTAEAAGTQVGNAAEEVSQAAEQVPGTGTGL